jgi:hypothetical protein
MALLNKTKMQVAAKATSQRAAFVRAPVVVRAQKQAQEAEVVRAWLCRQQLTCPLLAAGTRWNLEQPRDRSNADVYY